jgi:hypothetical protein
MNKPPAVRYVLGFVQVSEWPSLGFTTPVPIEEANALLHLAKAVESAKPLDLNERAMIAVYLRELASSEKLLRLLRPQPRGRQAGRRMNIGMHYAVMKELLGSAGKASKEVARIWGVEPHTVEDNDLNSAAVERVEELVRLRLVEPSAHPEQFTAKHLNGDWTRRAVLEALDRDLCDRAATRM